MLLGAQKLGDNIIRDSKAKAEVILADAEGQVKQVFSDSETKIAKERETLSMLQKETSEFKTRLLAMYKQHLELISLMPEEEKEPVPEVKEEPAEEPAVEPEISEEAKAEEDAYFDEVSMAETKRIELDVQE